MLATFFTVVYANGQNLLVEGVVLDSVNHKPLQSASVMIPGAGKGVLTDSQGKFRIVTDSGTRELRVSATGYSPATVEIPNSATGPLTVLLSVSYAYLQAVTVNSTKHYRNKHNPAVDLIREVIAHKEENSPAYYPYLTSDQYDKVKVLTDRPPRLFTNGRPFRPYRFLFTPDTTMIPGKRLVPAFLEETFSRNYSQLHPPRKRQVILGHKRINLGEYVDIGGVSAIINKLYLDFSVYDNTMLVFTLQFMSPVAKLAPDLYEYFIQDTVQNRGERLVHLKFIPRNSRDLLFSGDLYITLDGHYAIRKADMEASTLSNLNWVRSFQITQDFEKGPDGRYFRSHSEMLSYFSLLKNNWGFYGQRSITVTNVADSVLPDAVFNGLPVDTTLMSVAQPDSFWAANRPTPLTDPETQTYNNTDSLVKMKSYRRLMDLVTFLTVGYKSAGKFDIGPAGNFYSFNSLEGSRYQFGGRSNVRLSTRIFTDDYVAYATGDQRWKYYLSATWSLNHKSIYTYPFHFIQGSFLRDTRNPGVENQFAQDNSFLASFNRGIGGKWLYTDIANLTYIQEFGDHISYSVGARYWMQQPAQNLYYIYEPQPGSPDTIRSLSTSQLSLTVGWAPHEQFYQGRLSRRTITNQYPVFRLQYALGVKGPLGGQYNYNAFHLGVSKRWYVAPLGFTDFSINAGYLSGNLPFPLLIIAAANTSFFYSFGAYNLMNVEEFVSDHFAGLNVDHYFNGFFFNKIPLFRRLRLREVVEGKILYGGIRPENNPALNAAQMKFPLNNEGLLSTYSLGNQPYIEAGVGVYNIFNIFRVDLIRRFTYLDHPGISTTGIRLSTGLNF